MADKDKPLPPELQKAYDQLKNIRTSKTVALKPTPMLRQEITGLDGKPQPLRLRYYQAQGIYHLLMMKRMILADGTGLGKCVVGDTLLSTDRGLVPIGSLAPKVELTPDTFYDLDTPVRVNLDGNFVPVRRFYWNGEAPTYKLLTRDGYTVTGSVNHPVRVRGVDGEGYTKLPDVQEGEHYACIERRGTFAVESPLIPFTPDVAGQAARYNAPERLTPELARLLGYIVAEGTMTSPYHTVVTQHEDKNPTPHQDIRQLFSSVFGWSDQDIKSIDRTENIRVSSIWIRQYLAACGVDYTTAHHKTVPWVILQGTREDVRQFLRGIFEGEGSAGPGGVEFSTSSEKLGQQIQLLLLQFGVLSTRKPKKVAGYDHTYWRLTISSKSAYTFADQIGFVSTRKQEALTKNPPALHNPNKDVVPHARELIERVRATLSARVRTKESKDTCLGAGLKQFGETFLSKLKHVRSGNRNPTYGFLQELWDACEKVGLANQPDVQELRELMDAQYYYDPVVGIVEDGVQPLMDIEVDDPRHAFTANGLVNHNTCQVIGALCYLWPKEPANKVIIVGPKSAIRQWDGEFKKFAQNIKTYVVSTSTPAERKKVYQAWAAHPTDSPEKPVLLVSYPLLVKDWDQGAGKADPKNPKSPVMPGLLHGIVRGVENVVVVLDEATAFKTLTTKTWQVCAQLSRLAHRAYGLTATLLKNNLMEGFSIYKAIVPDLFTTKTAFMNDYCVTRLTPVAGGRSVPLVVGYRNLQHFRDKIDPFFLGRPKHVVSDELPTLITKEITCELGPAEDAKYSEALSGVFELGDGTVKDYEEHKAFVSLIYCQQVVNSLAALKFEAGAEIETGLYRDEYLKIDKLGAKEQALFDLITDELEDEKVIVYTRFESVVGRLQKILADQNIKSVRITGKEDDKARRRNQDLFQNLESDTKVIFITDAGSEAINLQAASAMIFYDAPWSWGNYVQLLGRPIRIGSPHQHIVVYHLVAERPREKKKDRKTIDHHVLSLLQTKKNLIDRVLGESAVGALDFSQGGSGTKELMRRLQGKDSSDE